MYTVFWINPVALTTIAKYWETNWMVPTFVSGHKFCASHKAWFTYHAHTKVDIDIINNATKYVTKIKAKLSHCDQINILILNTSHSSILLATVVIHLKN